MENCRAMSFASNPAAFFDPSSASLWFPPLLIIPPQSPFSLSVFVLISLLKQYPISLMRFSNTLNYRWWLPSTFSSWLRGWNSEPYLNDVSWDSSSRLPGSTPWLLSIWSLDARASSGAMAKVYRKRLRRVDLGRGNLGKSS